MRGVLLGDVDELLRQRCTYTILESVMRANIPRSRHVVRVLRARVCSAKWRHGVGDNMLPGIGAAVGVASCNGINLTRRSSIAPCDWIDWSRNAVGSTGAAPESSPEALELAE